VKAYGHNVYLVASVTNQSGQGGTAIYAQDRNLVSDGEFGILSQLYCIPYVCVYMYMH
jgi:5'-nucleotidase